MKFLGKGIAFCGLCFSATYLETHGSSSGGLWFLIVIWVILGTWSDNK